MRGNRLEELERGAARLAALRRRMEHWRQRRQKRAPMPPELWVAAAQLAREQGTNRIARALGLNSQRLKDHLGESRQDTTGGVGAGGFVELGTVRLPAAEQSVVEVSEGSSRKLVIRLAGTPDVAALIAAFWR